MILGSSSDPQAGSTKKTAKFDNTRQQQSGPAGTCEYNQGAMP